MYRTHASQALQRGIDSVGVKGGVLFIPEGVYRVTRKLRIVRPHTVLRGAGPGRTTLYFPLSLTDVYNNSWAMGNTNNSDYCW